jgi:hypothetical protein
MLIALLVLCAAVSLGAGVDVAAQNPELERSVPDDNFEPPQVLDLVDAGPDAPVTGPARCGASPDLIYLPGVGIDCRFDRSASGSDDEDPFVELLTGEEELQSFWPCDVTADEIVCRYIEQEDASRGDFFFDGLQDTLSLFYNSTRYDGAGSFETRYAPIDERALVKMRAFHPAVLEGQPLLAFAYGRGNGENLILLIRERDGTDIVATHIIEDPSAVEPLDLELDLDLPLGDYRLWGCVGETADDCEELPGGDPFQIIDGSLTELIEGHNRPNADRINIVFSQTGLPDPDQPASDPNDGFGPSLALADVAMVVMGIDGPVESFGTLAYGPFSIEPLASNLHRFNFWLLPAELNTNRSLIGDLESDPAAWAGFDLPNVSVVTFYTTGDARSDARLPKFASDFELPTERVQELPDDAIRFGGTRVWIDTFDYASAGQVLAHEWGHALFGLRDEYAEDRGLTDIPVDLPPEAISGVQFGYPNCAPTQEIAEAWWSDQLGAVDPFIDTVLEDYAEAGLDVPDFLSADALRTEITAGGCFGDPSVDSGVFRPGVNSLMNDVQLPVFGSINRMQVERILERYSGRGVAASAADVELTCERTPDATACAGTLRSYLDAPSDSIELNGEVCAVDAAADPVGLTCPELAGDVASATVTLGGDSAEVALPPIAEPPVSSTAPATTAGDGNAGDGDNTSDGDAPNGDDDDDEAPGESASPMFWVGLGILVLAGLLAVAMVRVRRAAADTTPE